MKTREFSFEKLDTWQKAKNFVKEVYIGTNDFPGEEKYGLTSQMRRAAISIVSNLAEGSGRITGKDKAKFTSMAFSSLMETANQAIIAFELRYLKPANYLKLRTQAEELSRMLTALRNSQLGEDPEEG
jgi:four helix bundle protein